MTSKTDNGFELDSFERFSDKLCEELISYLSISDKIRLECVSKQWKSLIFNKQKSIVINCHKDRKDSIQVSTNITSDRNLFENILQKFAFIEQIYILCPTNNCKIFEALLNNSNHLKAISSSGDFSNDELIKKFGQNCGQKLKCIYENSNEEQDLKKIFCLTPNLEKINFFIRNYDFNNEIYFSKLKEICFPLNMNLNDFKTFTSLYHKQIERIYLEIRSEMNVVLNQLSRFVVLQQLMITINITSNSNLEIEYLFKPKENGLISIANKCKSLKSLKIDMLSHITNQLKDENLCENFSGFTALEKLIFSPKFGELNNINIEPLKNCKNLNHLELNVYALRRKALEDIDLYLPNLKTIVIYLNYSFRYKFNSGIFRKLAKCKSLTKLVINIDYSQIFDSLINYVLKICSKIREIYFDGIHFKITRKTLDLLNNYAKNNPKFDYEFNNKLKKDEEIFPNDIKRRQFYNLYVKNW
jgi:hypothetical protein